MHWSTIFQQIQRTYYQNGNVKMAYSFCFGLRGNLDFPYLLQKKFYNINYRSKRNFLSYFKRSSTSEEIDSEFDVTSNYSFNLHQSKSSDKNLTTRQDNLKPLGSKVFENLESILMEKNIGINLNKVFIKINLE